PAAAAGRGPQGGGRATGRDPRGNDQRAGRAGRHRPAGDGGIWPLPDPAADRWQHYHGDAAQLPDPRPAGALSAQDEGPRPSSSRSVRSSTPSGSRSLSELEKPLPAWDSPPSWPLRTALPGGPSHERPS